MIFANCTSPLRPDQSLSLRLVQEVAATAGTALKTCQRSEVRECQAGGDPRPPHHHHHHQLCSTGKPNLETSRGLRYQSESRYRHRAQPVSLDSRTLIGWQIGGQAYNEVQLPPVLVTQACPPAQTRWHHQFTFSKREHCWHWPKGCRKVPEVNQSRDASFTLGVFPVVTCQRIFLLVSLFAVDSIQFLFLSTIYLKVYIKVTA